jgi:hypothetical protein
LLLHDKIAKEIFLQYDERDWSGYYALPPGTYAFICPDTTFQKIYPSILEEFPHAIATDGLIYQKAFYRDSVKGVYIDGSFGPQQNIVFTKIKVDSDTAEIEFFTTAWFNLIRFDNTYVSVMASLRKKDGQWFVENCKVKRIEWREYFKKRYIR